ncbi:unnamed protein product [Pleuronectes platessa]|uniref:Uncharacterized protein n=1 Tax=Pleuronectes platessa TaxID=8262 RepID=A0A9N7UNK9_PLEPL|nr:unnamed protein product [Pleuronectes platessa]
MALLNFGTFSLYFSSGSVYELYFREIMDPNRRPRATSGSSGDSSPASPGSSCTPAGDKASTPGWQRVRQRRQLHGDVQEEDGGGGEEEKGAASRRRSSSRRRQSFRTGTDTSGQEAPCSDELCGEAQRRRVPKDRHGCEEAERRLRGKSDAWASYMAEVKKYKAHQCGDDDKTRPLVK